MIVEQPRFFYAFSVWGDQYVEHLGRFALPSLMAPRNIPSLPNKAVSQIVIATTPEDEQSIRALPIFPMVEANIPVVFLPLPSSSGDKYHRLTLGHAMAARRAIGQGYAVFLGPDAIHSDGMMQRLYNHAMAGRHAVVGMGPRIRLASTIEALTQQGSMSPGKPLVLPPRAMARILLDHVHPDYLALRYGSKTFPSTPYAVNWLFDQGILIRSFSLHPYLLSYLPDSGNCILPDASGAVDNSFVNDCGISPDRLHIVTDSDEFIVLSATPEAERDFTDTPGLDSFTSLRAWALEPLRTELQRSYFMHGIKIHAQDLDKQALELETETLKLAYQINRESPGAAELNTLMDTVASFDICPFETATLRHLLRKKVQQRLRLIVPQKRH